VYNSCEVAGRCEILESAIIACNIEGKRDRRSGREKQRLVKLENPQADEQGVNDNAKKIKFCAWWGTTQSAKGAEKH
jgi:hypothetical protein